MAIFKKKEAASQSKAPKKNISVPKLEHKADHKIKGLAARVLIRPLLSEKATVANARRQYVFVVAKNANKISVKKAIKEIYGVEPLAVNIINRAGKRVRRGRSVGYQRDIKKAIVTLRTGDSIKIYEGV